VWKGHFGILWKLSVPVSKPSLAGSLVTKSDHPVQNMRIMWKHIDSKVNWGIQFLEGPNLLADRLEERHWDHRNYQTSNRSLKIEHSDRSLLGQRPPNQTSPNCVRFPWEHRPSWIGWPDGSVWNRWFPWGL
jgi:hypothetical protein